MHILSRKMASLGAEIWKRGGGSDAPSHLPMPGSWVGSRFRLGPVLYRYMSDSRPLSTRLLKLRTLSSPCNDARNDHVDRRGAPHLPGWTGTSHPCRTAVPQAQCRPGTIGCPLCELEMDVYCVFSPSDVLTVVMCIVRSVDISRYSLCPHDRVSGTPPRTPRRRPGRPRKM